MKKICSQAGCKAIVSDGGYRCPKHPPKPVKINRKARYSHHYHEGKNIYYTNRWKRIRKVVLDAEPLCTHCKKLGIFRPAKIVDHIKEVVDGGDLFDIDNLEGLCFSHHNTKTAREKKAREKVGRSLSDY